MKISEIMETNIRKVSIDKDQLLIDAIELMKKQNLSTLLCINEDKLAGILTERELADRLGSSKSKAEKTSSLHVSTSMFYKPKTVSPETDISEAAEIMLKEGVSGLPVVDKGRLEGLITYNEMTQICEKLNDAPVRKIMTKNPITIYMNDRLIHARKILFDKKVSVLPVLDEEKLVGMISEGMIARAFANFRDTVPVRYQKERLKHILVADAMRVNPPILREEDSIGQAAKTLLEEGMRAISIANEYELVGLVSKTDMVKLVKNNLKVD